MYISLNKPARFFPLTLALYNFLLVIVRFTPAALGCSQPCGCIITCEIACYQILLLQQLTT